MDEWNESDEGVIEGECERCHRKTLVQLNDDPFIAEIFPEDDNPKSYWCKPCWEARADDI